MTYEVAVTAVSERADLFVRAMELLLGALDAPPARILVHEDVRPGSRPGGIGDWLRTSSLPHEHRVADPPRGMGAGMVWCFERATTPIVLYTQEDWGAVRPIPVGTALALMQSCGLHHVRFNKRKTMRAKHADTDHPWEKVEVVIGGQVLCVSDHWYTQTSLWRVAEALPGLRVAAVSTRTSEQFVAAFNAAMNAAHGDPARPWNDQAMRHERLRTYIWGPVGEPRFVEHLGSRRGTGAIVDHLAPKARP